MKQSINLTCGVARCKNCGFLTYNWKNQPISTILKICKDHAKKSKHKVIGKLEIEFMYDGKN